MRPAGQDESLEDLLSFVEDLTNALTISRRLVEDGRLIDLSGLDGQVGLLCAKALDLPPEVGRVARSAMIALMGEIDLLTKELGSRTGG
jgi:hypothetical protein